MRVLRVQNEASYRQLLKDNFNKTIIADFTADWCEPGQEIEPIFEQLANQHPRSIFVRVDLDGCKGIAKEFQDLPTFRCLEHGHVIDEIGGAKESQLREMIARHIH